MALAAERVKYYDDMSEMFATTGWKDLIDEMTKEVYEKQADALQVGTWEEVCEMRGHAKAYAILINLKEMTAMQKANEEADALQEGSTLNA